MKVFATIDCGSNSTRILIKNNDRTDIHRKATITMIGAEVQQTGVLSDGGIQRVLHCLHEYKEMIDAHNVTNLTIFATEAVRQASNANDFLNDVNKIFGQYPIVLDGRTEAQNAFHGSTMHLSNKDDIMVIDIGGCSTELATVSEVMSIPIGCVSLSSEYNLSSLPLNEKDLILASDAIRGVMTPVNIVINNVGLKTAIATSGTVTCVFMIANGIEQYSFDEIHSKKLKLSEVQSVFEIFSRTENLSTIKGMEGKREKSIVSGVIILKEVMKCLNLNEVVISERDIMDGVLDKEIAKYELEKHNE